MKPAASLFILMIGLNACMAVGPNSIGDFPNHGDIGRTLKPGSAKYDEARERYTIAGSGENMWFGADAFHFVWKEASGDLSIEAAIEWLSKTGNPHRKACLMFRQSLAADSPYIDVAVHGDGLTSLQYRMAPGGNTFEIQANTPAPQRVQLLKRGEFVFLSCARQGEKLKPSGAAMKFALQEPFLVGLAVCAHDSNAIAQAEFSGVKMRPLARQDAGQLKLRSTLETVAISSGDRRVVYHTDGHFEAPNWMPNGTALLFNSNGRLYTVPVKGGEPKALDTGFATHCNNDHGISPDGKRLAISDQTKDGKSRVYVLPITGGTPRLITEQGPSYWHGWSPDGRTLAYCAERNGVFDVYTIPIEGGPERRLTIADGLDDGPEYSPDGKWIYFNSDRTGIMQIWRMRPDGTGQEQVTSDEFNNWFAHPSPDGKWIVFLSYDKTVKGHPANKDVSLRLMRLETGEIKPLAQLFGGQGTINVPSWSPDSRQVAFVSYQLVAD